MATIKFSHRYRKLLSENGEVVKQAVLLDVVEVELSDLSQPFIDYDTDGGLFRLPKNGTYMMLLLKKCGPNNGDNLFTTLRRLTSEKDAYYRGFIGKVVDIEIVKPKEGAV